MSKMKKGYYRPELQLILCNECDIVCASGEVDDYFYDIREVPNWIRKLYCIFQAVMIK